MIKLVVTMTATLLLAKICGVDISWAAVFSPVIFLGLSIMFGTASLVLIVVVSAVVTSLIEGYESETKMPSLQAPCETDKRQGDIPSHRKTS